MGAVGRCFKNDLKQSMREQTTNLNDLSPYNHHHIKKIFILLENLIVRNYIIFSFWVIMKNQRHKDILRLSMNPQL